MKEKRRDSKGRILHTGESQRTDGKYLYKYVDAFGNTKYVYAWRLTCKFCSNGTPILKSAVHSF